MNTKKKEKSKISIIIVLSANEKKTLFAVFRYIF